MIDRRRGYEPDTITPTHRPPRPSFCPRARAADRLRAPGRSVARGVCESLDTRARLACRDRCGRDLEGERMMYDSQRMSADGDASADPSKAAAAPLSRPASADRTATMAAELHALPALLTVGETAQIFRMGRSWVYEHAIELGAIKLGQGQTAPLRIPRDEVLRILGAALPRRERRRLPTTRAPKAGRPNGDLRARPRL
jgi:hypothetical protein